MSQRYNCLSTGFVSTGGVSAFLQLHSTEEETEEVDDDTLNDDVIAESIPLPRQLPGEGRSVLVAMRNKTRKTGVFPELDSALLKVYIHTHAHSFMTYPLYTIWCPLEVSPHFRSC